MNCTHIHAWLDDFLTRHVDTPPPVEMAEHIKTCPACQHEYEVAIQTLTSIRLSCRVEASPQLKGKIMSSLMNMNAMEITSQPVKRHRFNLWRPITALAAMVLVCTGATILCLGGWGGKAGQPLSAFSLLSNAWAAEKAAFTAGGAVHFVNEIIVKSISDPVMAQARWFPLMALDATGKSRTHQLALGATSGEEYTVDDQAWYDPATGRFVRLLSAGSTPLFANSYDGKTVYSLEVSPEGAQKVIADPIAEGFHAPESPAAFLGIAAGLPNRLDELDKSLVTDAGEVKLADGTQARVIKSCPNTPDGISGVENKSYFLFKIREDDNTIAEMEWILGGTSALVIRRVHAENVDAANMHWDLTEIPSLLAGSHQTTKQTKPGMLSVLSDMVVSEVSVQRMAEKADFETYIFQSAPSWAGERQITDFLDVASPPHRAFTITYRAGDGRHVVFVQSPSYSKVGPKAKTGNLVYESPNGMKVWTFSKSKWMADILIKSARATIKDPSSEARTGYILETPAGTFPALAINGPVTESELHTLIDSLIPAKEYKGQ